MVESLKRRVRIPPEADQPWAGAVNRFIMYYVYILRSEKTSRIYKGCTNDLESRLKEHNSGCTQSTKAFLPWKLIYCEVFTNKTDARKEELFLKTGKGRERIKYLLQNTLGGFA